MDIGNKLILVVVLATLVLVGLGLVWTAAVNTFEQVNAPIDEAEAVKIARSSVCGGVGTMGSRGFYNANTDTWWIDITLNDTEGPCQNPACVVDVATGSADINWRCTGLIMQEVNDE